MRHRLFPGDDGSNGVGGGGSGGIGLAFSSYQFAPNQASLTGFASPLGTNQAPPGPGLPAPAQPFYLNKAASGDNRVVFDSNCPVGLPDGVGNVSTLFSGSIQIDPLTGAPSGTLTGVQTQSGDMPVTSYFVPPPAGGWPAVNLGGDSIPDMFASGLGYFLAAQVTMSQAGTVWATVTPPQGCFILNTGLTGYAVPAAGFSCAETLSDPDRVDYAATRAGIPPLATPVNYSDADNYDPLTGELDGLFTHCTLSMFLP